MSEMVPFADMSESQMIIGVAVQKLRPRFPGNCAVTKKTVDIVNRCWDYDPFKRPTISECVSILTEESATFRPLRILSIGKDTYMLNIGYIMNVFIDHGDLRSAGSLHILEKVMKGISESAKPCEYFDVIGGVGTGGFVSISLSRARYFYSLF